MRSLAFGLAPDTSKVLLTMTLRVGQTVKKQTLSFLSVFPKNDRWSADMDPRHQDACFCFAALLKVSSKNAKLYAQNWKSQYHSFHSNPLLKKKKEERARETWGLGTRNKILKAMWCVLAWADSRTSVSGFSVLWKHYHIEALGLGFPLCKTGPKRICSLSFSRVTETTCAVSCYFWRKIIPQYMLVENF